MIGTTAKYVSVERALDHVAGYCVVNDVSERSYQLEGGGQWDNGKGCDTFAPIGPWLVTSDEIPDPQALDLWLDVDGHRPDRKHSNHDFQRSPLGLSHQPVHELRAGDVIATGTPPGVGMGQKPPRYLTVGQSVPLGINSLGRKRNAWYAPPISESEHFEPI